MIFGRKRRDGSSDDAEPHDDRPQARDDRPLDRERIVDYLEGVLEAGGADERAIERRLRDSQTDRAFFEAIREEIENRNTSISLVWRQERVSCPHRDLLLAYHLRSLSDAEADYIRFHVERIRCPYCVANLDDVSQSDASSPDAAPMRDLKDELLRSTTAFLRRR